MRALLAALAALSVLALLGSRALVAAEADACVVTISVSREQPIKSHKITATWTPDGARCKVE